jgi:hypothetical protein
MTESAIEKRRRQERRRAAYLRETGRGVTLVPAIAAHGAAPRAAAVVKESLTAERARRWEEMLRAARTAQRVA